MEGRRTKQGTLEIRRGKHPDFVAVRCVKQDIVGGKEIMLCNDRCPFFGEPEVALRKGAINGSEIDCGDKRLDLCERPIFFESFQDERE